ncbi:MAG TPA: proline--tRNA ligase [Candidatus Andersenbacteria bacterium]|nr:MAG: proline--tRNA ligase [Parcubacteria group bacterium RIFCSPHIGHO2_01_FULL_56_18]HLD26152.1 proline--tRNA ligase [Candidatus Andersenbacteria bacterium]
MAFSKETIPKKSAGLSEWYNKVVLEAELADYGPAKGTMIFRPYGFAIWEQIRALLDVEIKKRGVENAYWPLFIPESLLHKEKEHVEGFSPELAVVTIGGGEELTEKLVIRPTSETIMYQSYAKWIQSWRDLPMQINQWNNVVRWEKRTYLFLRTSEFLWQEGHTAHATHAEASATVSWAMDMYERFYRENLAIPGYVLVKSEQEKFAGADMTLSYETLMPEGKALQSSTSHDLGQNFSRAFEIAFLDQQGSSQHVWQTSWGLSTRSIGALLMTHGDDNGLRFPPRIAPIQVVIVPIRDAAETIAYAEEIKELLRAAGLRVRLENRGNESLGYTINKWELKGVPLRLEVGPKEVVDGVVTAVRRDNFVKEKITYAALAETVSTLLEDIQAQLYKEADDFLGANTREANTYDDFKKIMATQRGFIRCNWCEEAACEKAIKDETKASTRGRQLEQAPVEGQCFRCGKPAQRTWLFAQSY